MNVPENLTYEMFCHEIEMMLGSIAKEKGYNTTGPNGENVVYKFIYDATGDHGHGIGEIIYKAIRYMRKRDPEDLLKLSAWSYLIWKHHYFVDNDS
jgi:alpha/beta superfamily hydrolase